ncbi:MAG TPA: hypothetical protein VKD72_34920 [Gemmataceae bacterium]|nr:hypothetical protein [Gemmataceae bacterium]
MADSYRHIIVERHGNAACVRLIKVRLNENEVHELSRELLRLGKEDGCPRIALCLGPQTPECLYSVFLAKLISLQRRLGEIGGALKLCQCTPQVIEILDACVLLDRFDLVDNPTDALAQWGVGPVTDGPPPSG